MDKLNELPQGWKWVKLGDVCENTATRNPSLESDFYYVDISSVDNEIKKIVSPKLTLGKEASSRARKVILENDVIVSTTRPNLNAVAIIPTELNNQIASTGFCVIRAKYNLLDNQYLFSFVKSSYFVENLSDEVRGALYPAVTDKQVFAQYIPLPPFPEQQRLATLLTAKLALIEQAKEKITAQLQAAQELTAAYLREVFESEDFNKTLFEDIAFLQRGHDLTTSQQIKGEYPVVTSSGINGWHNQFTVKSPCVMTGRSGSIGKVHYIEQDCWAHNTSLFIKDFKGNNPKYIYFLLNFIDLGKVCSGSGVPTLDRKWVHKLLVPHIKNTDKQKQLANYLTEKLATVEQLKATLQTQLDSINQLPAALLKQAFSGQL